MIRKIDQFYFDQKEPNKSCFMALREIVYSFNEEMTEHWKYKLPFFYYKGQPFCYFWTDKKTSYPYIGMIRSFEIDHPLLILGKRKRIKILMINPNEDIPLEIITEVLTKSLSFYK